ncbi:MAG: RagB/SusD family nutrient uptake outer membrane protein [Cyclobacteriaceae bacterium]
MRKYIIYNFLLALLLLFGSVGCEDFLEETSVTDITADSYIINEEGYEDLVKACYPKLRDFIMNYSLVLKGTDIIGSNWTATSPANGPALDQYNVSLNSEVGALQEFWDDLYKEISRTNSAIERAEGVAFSNPALKAARVAEAKFLRALSYFYLVQTWGDVPMPLTETVTANREVTRVPSDQVYTQILTDLLEAEADLPVTPSDYGRATKGAAQFLLSKVYLTRGWNFNNSLGGSNADFQEALEWADKIIAAYPLVSDYSMLFPERNTNPLNQYSGPQNAVNSEVVFAVQFNEDNLTNGSDQAQPGNYYHSIWPGNSELVGSVGRTSDYNRHLWQNVPQPSMYRLYDPQQDSRYSHNFLNVIYALTPVNNYAYSFTDPGLTVSYNVGDTVAYWTPWNQPATGADLGFDEGGTKPYSVTNIDDYVSGLRPTRLSNSHPTTWKFWEPNIEYGDGYGTFDYALFRSAEAYLIAAEAIVKGATGGALGGADVYYNVVVDRAVGAGNDPMCAQVPEDINDFNVVSYRATPGNIDIDMILDERARELMGEFTRWFDLKRTEKLIDRVSRMNLWAANGGEIDEHHLLRPIPQGEIDRASTVLQQNPEY